MIQLIPSYPKQVTWDVWLPLLPQKGTTTVTTGLIAAAYSVSGGAIASFATRFGSTFVEYRIVQVRMGLRCFSATNPGVLQVWYDEKSASAPVSAEATERYIDSINASSVDTNHSYLWTAEDPLDLQYVATSTTPVPVTFKVFTNNTTFGSSVVATDYFELEGYTRVQFRGLLGV